VALPPPAMIATFAFTASPSYSPTTADGRAK